MYKIENLNDIIKESESLDKEIEKLNITASMKDLNSRLSVIEKGFNKINPIYTIEVTPYLDSVGNTELKVELKCVSDNGNLEIIHDQDTLFNFRKVEGGNCYYNSKVDIDYSEQPIEHMVTFKQEPKLYTDLLENDLINAFLKQQKLLKQEDINERKNKLARKKLKN